MRHEEISILIGRCPVSFGPTIKYVLKSIQSQASSVQYNITECEYCNVYVGTWANTAIKNWATSAYFCIRNARITHSRRNNSNFSIYFLHEITLQVIVIVVVVKLIVWYPLPRFSVHEAQAKPASDLRPNEMTTSSSSLVRIIDLQSFGV